MHQFLLHHLLLSLHLCQTLLRQLSWVWVCQVRDDSKLHLPTFDSTAGGKKHKLI